MCKLTFLLVAAIEVKSLFSLAVEEITVYRLASCMMCLG